MMLLVRHRLQYRSDAAPVASRRTRMYWLAGVIAAATPYVALAALIVMLRVVEFRSAGWLLIVAPAAYVLSLGGGLLFSQMYVTRAQREGLPWRQVEARERAINWLLMAFPLAILAAVLVLPS